MSKIQRSRHCIPATCRGLLYYALFHPHHIWLGSMGWIKQDTVEAFNISLKKKALKLINNNQSRRSAGVNLFKKYNILTLKDLYSRQLSQLMYKAFHNSLPPVIQQLFIRVNSDRNTRQNAYMHIILE